MKSAQSDDPSTLYGIALVASGAIGAGMFALPIVSAGMWFAWAVLCLSVVWFVTFLAALLLLESNLLFPPGASFNTIVGSSLGRLWCAANNISIAFIMYILLYAYFSASGSIVAQTYSSTMHSESPLSQNAWSLLFGLVIGLLVWSGTAKVGRVCAVLLVGMVITFLLSTSGLILALEFSKLFLSETKPTSLAPFICMSLPYFVTSFACAGIVPSLVKYYGHKPDKIKQSLLYGTLLALIVYILWLTATFGSLSREQFAPIIAAGGNMGQLVGALQTNAHDDSMHLILNLFSNFAITTSFLSIGLGLFDFFADRFKFADHGSGRAKSALLTFLPPAIFSFILPQGFILAIGYAGLLVLFSFFIVPVAMSLANRSKALESAALGSDLNGLSYQVGGGKPLLYGIIIFSLLVGLFKILGSLDRLPIYP